jgi:hypothetical protein
MQRDNMVASPRRRKTLAAAGAAMLAPALGRAADACTSAGNPFGAGGGRLVLSGQVRDAAGRPLAGQAFELRGTHGLLGRASTDGDGRFVLEMRAPGKGERLAWFSDIGTPRQIRFAAVQTSASEATARVMRDADGNWRAAVALSLA